MTQSYVRSYIASGSVGYSAGDGRMTCGTSVKGSTAAFTLYFYLVLNQLFRLIVRLFAHNEGQKRENWLDIFENPVSYRMVMLSVSAHNPTFGYLRTGHPL